MKKFEENFRFLYVLQSHKKLIQDRNANDVLCTYRQWSRHPSQKVSSTRIINLMIGTLQKILKITLLLLPPQSHEHKGSTDSFPDEELCISSPSTYIAVLESNCVLDLKACSEIKVITILEMSNLYIHQRPDA